MPTTPTLVYFLSSAGSVAFLVGFIVATTMFQHRATRQMSDILMSVPDALQDTAMWRSARTYFDRRLAVNFFTGPAHAIPTWFLIIVVTFCSSFTFLGANWFRDIDTPSYVLGGPLAANSPASRTHPVRQVDSPDASGAPPRSEQSQDQHGSIDLTKYQSSTVCMVAFAFLGAYVYIISQLVNRLDNNDLSPVSFYFLSCRIISACLVAAIGRQMVEAIPGLRTVINTADGTPAGLAVLGFLIGWNPTLWINELILKASSLIGNQIPFQRLPNKASLPENFSLAMIRGINDSELERLTELNINNFLELARYNVFLIWTKTAYKPELICDWIAQSQLCCIFESDKISILRNIGINDIFIFIDGVKDNDARKKIADKIQVDETILALQASNLQSEPSFVQLQQFRTALTMLR